MLKPYSSWINFCFISIFVLEANPLECEICKLLINELDKYLVTNATKDKIEEAVTKFCDSLPAEIKAFVSTVSMIVPFCNHFVFIKLQKMIHLF